MDTQQLTPPEVARLENAEIVIEAGIKHFVAVGKALAEIRDLRLYRQTHDTFESYLDGRWNLSRAYAHRLIGAAEVAENVAHGQHGEQLEVANERQARELAKVEPDRRADVLLAASEGGPATAKTIREAAQVETELGSMPDFGVEADAEAEPEPGPVSDTIDGLLLALQRVSPKFARTDSVWRAARGVVEEWLKRK